MWTELGSLIVFPEHVSSGVEVLEEQTEPSDEMIEYESPQQLSEQLVTLSLLPESRWKNLLNLDVIKVAL